MEQRHIFNTVGIFSMPDTEEQAILIQRISERISASGIKVRICPFTEQKLNKLNYSIGHESIGATLDEIDFVISIGGDGTVLKASRFVGMQNKPILAINAGRLGFLADINIDEIDEIISDVKKETFTIEERSVLEVCFKCNGNEEKHFALNEIAIHKQGLASLLTINTTINGEYLCSFWSDGIIVATPTGSTAYSLSLGGPIISPNTKALIINPIAPHTLSVRPIIIPDNSTINLSVTGRSTEYNISFDSDQILMNEETEITIKKANYPIKFLKFDRSSYFSTLREKLMWGTDIRN